MTIIGVLTTVVSFYYYLSVIVQMYMREPKERFEGADVASGVGAAPDRHGRLDSVPGDTSEPGGRVGNRGLPSE